MFQIYSPHRYKEAYEAEVKGKSITPSMLNFPQHKHAIKVGNLISQNVYVKEADKTRHLFTLPADMPSIQHARGVNDMISQVQIKRIQEFKTSILTLTASLD